MSNFTCRQAQNVYKISDVTARKIALAKWILGAAHYQPDNDMFDDSVVDYFYSLYEFCTVRGMPWKEVVAAVKFANEFLRFIPETPMEKAILQLRTGLMEYVENGLLGTESAKKLTRYFVSSVINHYKLFQLVLTQPQEVQTTSGELLVQVPRDGCLLPLAIAETEADHQFNLKMRALTDKRDQRLQEVDLQKEALVERTQQVEQSFDLTLQEAECAPNRLDFDDAKSIVRNITADKFSLVGDDLSLVMSKMREELTFQIEQKALVSSRDNPKKSSSRSGSAKSSKSKKGKKK